MGYVLNALQVAIPSNRVKVSYLGYCWWSPRPPIWAVAIPSNRVNVSYNWVSTKKITSDIYVAIPSNRVNVSYIYLAGNSLNTFIPKVAIPSNRVNVSYT